MAQQELIERKASKRSEEPPAPTKAEEQKAKVEKIKADTDSLMDEIDEILVDSVEFTKNYVQAGGE